MRHLCLILLTAAACAPMPPAHPHWTYAGAHGPAHWGELDPHYRTCRTGHAQTPIDLAVAEADPSELPLLSYTRGPAKLTNNGHTVQFAGPAGSTLSLDGATYALQQVHFHAPSEHTVDGRAYAMEAHFVHADAAGQLAVVGVLYDVGPENAPLAPLWAVLPTKAGVAAPDLAFDPSALIPTAPAAWHYEGSLTTPPCTEGVEWFVLVAPAAVSAAQVARWKAIFGPSTARPVQPRGEQHFLVQHP